MKIFISYGHEDYNIAKEIQLQLTMEHHEVFLDDKGTKESESYGSVIRNKLIDSDLLIFLISPCSVDKGGYTLSELDMYEDQYPSPSGRVLPVEVASIEKQLIPHYLNAVRWLKPKGNIAAEVAAKVEKIAREKNKCKISRKKFVICAVILFFLVILTLFYFKWNEESYPNNGEQTVFDEWIVLVDKYEKENDAQEGVDDLKLKFKEANWVRSNEDIFAVKSIDKKNEWWLIIDVGTGKSSPVIIRPYMLGIINLANKQGFYIQNRLKRNLDSFKIVLYDRSKYIKLYGKIAN